MGALTSRGPGEWPRIQAVEQKRDVPWSVGGKPLLTLLRPSKWTGTKAYDISQLTKKEKSKKKRRDGDKNWCLYEASKHYGTAVVSGQLSNAAGGCAQSGWAALPVATSMFSGTCIRDAGSIRLTFATGYAVASSTTNYYGTSGAYRNALMKNKKISIDTQKKSDCSATVAIFVAEIEKKFVGVNRSRDEMIVF